MCVHACVRVLNRMCLEKLHCSMRIKNILHCTQMGMDVLARLNCVALNVTNQRLFSSKTSQSGVPTTCLNCIALSVTTFS